MTGRIKDIVNRGGEKFSCADIEQVIAAHPAIASAAVLGVPDDRLARRWRRSSRCGRAPPGRAAGRSATTSKGPAGPPEATGGVAGPRRHPVTLSGKVQKHRLLDSWTEMLAAREPA